MNKGSDGNSELVLFKENGYAVINHSENGFEKPVIRSLNFSISNAIKLFDENNESIFAAIARKNRAVLIFSLSKDGIIRIIDFNKYFTYPSEINCYFNNINNSFTLIISGQNFSGLALLVINRQGKIIEKNHVKNTSYKSAYLLDLNWDFIPDIVAFNSIFNKLDFLYSNDGKSYYKERDYTFNDKCNNIQLYDINKDSYSDLIASVGDSFEILYGDSVYSYNKKDFMNVGLKPDNFVIKELNNTQFTEIIFSEKKTNKLYVLFEFGLNKNIKKLVEYSTGNIIKTDIYKDERMSKLFFLDNKYNLYCIEKINEINEKINLYSPSITGTIGGDLPLSTLFYIDNDNLTLNAISMDKNLFSDLFTCRIGDRYSKIKLFSKGNKNYFVMTKGESNNFGFAVLNLQNGLFKSKQYFSKNPIHDFSVNTIDEELILTLILKHKGKIELIRYKLDEDELISDEFVKVDVNVFDAKVNNFDPNDIFYWKYDKEYNNLFLNKYDIEKEKTIKISAVSIKDPSSIKINSLFLRHDKQPIYSAIINVDSLFYLATYNYKNGKLFITESKNIKQEILTNTSIENKLVWYNKFLFINNSKKGNFVKLDISNLNDGGIEKIELPFTDNYFITTINKKLYLVYITDNNNTIKFKEIGGNR